MSEDREQEIIKKLLSKTEMKAPSDMADRVFSALNKQREVTTYRPLLPSWFWWLSALAFSIFLFWSISNGPLLQVDSVLDPYLDRAANFFSSFNLEFSSIHFYSITAFAVMLFVNAIILKKRARII